MKTKIALTFIAALTAASSAHDFTVHEWGTFTTVMGSDGAHLDGVQREEAPLPPFVRRIDGLTTTAAAPGMKGIHWERPLAMVNVRMETPVVYFYTDREFEAQVDVHFHGGMISEWFPERSAGEVLPPIKRDPQGIPTGENRLDFSQPRAGSIRWNVKVEPAGEDEAARVFQGQESPCWLHPRRTDAALVTNAKGETEKYLFYRGLGNLQLPVTFTATDSTLKAASRSAEPVAHWLVYELSQTGEARWIVPPAVPAAGADGKGAEVPVEFASTAFRGDWKRPLFESAAKMLTDAGLLRREADAMLQTWWESYFLRPGLRVFWVVPPAYVDKVLPLTVSPPPAKTTRVIVGRAEILTPSAEQKLLNVFASADKDHGNAWSSDRFFPAYTRRVEQLLAAGKKADPAKWAGGTWQVMFQNGVQQTCEVAPDGTVKVTEPKRTATGRMTDTGNNGFEIHFSDDRVERWKLSSPPSLDAVTVHHWAEAGGTQTDEPVSGTGWRR